MQIQLSVVTFVPPDAKVAVLGSIAELGNWSVDKCVELEVHTRPKSHLEPSFWTLQLDLTEPVDPVPKRRLSTISFEYKFIRKCHAGGDWEFEGCGPDDNRSFVFDPEDIMSDGTCVVPPSPYMERDGVTEMSHTTRFYDNVKQANEIHYNLIYDRVYCGSCPRKKSHIDHLKSLGVTAIFNFQALEDLKLNFPDPVGYPVQEERTAEDAFKLYDDRGLVCVWMPTTDFSHEAKRRMLPQAAFVLKGLIAQGHCVYVHCNAGVGRSVGAVCAYLCYCEGFSIRKVHLIMTSKRPVAYFDERALRYGLDDYHKKFGNSAPTR